MANAAPHQLLSHYEQTKKDTAELVAQAIALIKKRKQEVSLASISQATFEITNGERRVAESTIQRNSEASNQHAALALAPIKKSGLKARLRLRNLPENERAKEAGVISRLMRKSKSDLVLELIDANRLLEKREVELSTLRAKILESITPKSALPSITRSRTSNN